MALLTRMASSFTKLARIALKSPVATHGRCRLFTYKSIPLLHNASIAKFESEEARVNGRLKREYVSHVHNYYETLFSKWKILIGENDRRDYEAGKEGCERYRTQNLPSCTFCPGIYELGIGIRSLQRGCCCCNNNYHHRYRVYDSSLVMPIYLGRADRVRPRLQQYGRNGSHLEKATLSRGIFEEILSNGCPILYRSILMKSSEDAKEVEDLMLRTFDYTLNSKKNGNSRPDDIRTGLECEGKCLWCKLLRLSSGDELFHVE